MNKYKLFSSLLTSHIKQHSTLYRKCIRFSEKFFLQQRLRFRYPDMTIHTSQRNMLNFFNTLIQPGRFSIVNTNIDVTRGQKLGACANRLLSMPNGGGSSIYSEALSVELLSRLLGVNLFKTELELKYNYPEVYNNGGGGPIMDYACHYHTSGQDQLILGVSVTRAMAYNRNYTKQDAFDLIEKKLKNMLKSSQNIVNTKFDRHILHVWTESGKNAAVVNRVCRKLKGHPDYKDTVVLISTINTDLVFFNNNYHLTLNKT